MEQKDFFNFDSILASIQKSAFTTNKENLNFSGVYSFHFKDENTKHFFVKHSINGEYKEVNLSKKRDACEHTIM